MPVPAKFWGSLKQQLTDKVWIVVFVAALISAVCNFFAKSTGDSVVSFDGFIQGISVIFTGVLMLMAKTYFDILKDSRFIELQSLIKDADLPVIRGKFGATHTISVWDLVVGDVVLLNPGDRVPGDCMILESENFEVEQKFKDNEKRRIRKQALNQQNKSADPFLQSESFVLQG